MYYGLDIGDIFRECSSNEYWVVYPSNSKTLDVLPIPARKLLNSPEKMQRIEGGKSGFQIYKCTEPLKIIGKTDFFAMEWLAWIDDKD